jgi:DUF4097 and DUF4098 domain-containing protein YvlB
MLLAVLLAAFALALLPQSEAGAERWLVVDDDDWCRQERWTRDEYVCEVREITIDADWSVITVDGGANGGISVEGWDRDEIRIRAKVKAWDREEEDARKTLDGIEIKLDRERIEADGPRMRGNRRGWSVSYELMVPHKSNLDLETLNGGIRIEDIDGDIRADATNGGLRLLQLAGDVDVHTTNGGLSVELHGDRWDGRGLDATTTNGGIKVWIPEEYNADLETGTVNGGIDFDFPVTVQGRISKQIRATLGDGGPRIRIKTTNGGVRLKQI